MALQHYVVTFDNVTNEWIIDDDTLTARFPDGTVYDDANEEWRDEYLGDAVTDNANEAMSNAVAQLNRKG
jgi:hypothetical protein